jgi:adenylate cyclase
VSLRSLRIASGLVMWLYMVAHMGNHILGLWSLAAAEKGLRLVIATVHFMPITVLLYGAFVLHLALALYGLYKRPGLAMSLSDFVRILMGLGFPLLLIGHVYATRVSHEWFALAPQYARVISGLIASGNEGRQLALLAPGWLHGCMGLDLNLRRRAALARWRPCFWAFALALPLLAAWGYLSMEKEVAGLLADPAWRIKIAPAVPSQHLMQLQHSRESLLNLYFALVGLVLGLCVLKHWTASRRKLARSDEP